MPLTNIGNQKTPARPIEIVFAPETGIPSALQEVLLIGHMREAAASGAGPTGSATPYQVVQVNNASDITAASGEVATKFGDGSELAKMVLAAVKAQALSGRTNFPALKCVPLLSTDTGFGASDAALTAAARVKAEFIVSCYDGMNSTLTGKLRDTAALMSSALRVDNNQYGTVGVAANQSVVDPSTLTKLDTQYLELVWGRDSAPAQLVGEDAAMVAATIAGQAIPFNSVDDFVLGGKAAPTSPTDPITVGGGLESETALNQGWTPLRVLPTGEVAIVRSVTSRVTVDGVVLATAYYDVQDFQVLYFWRKTLRARFGQPDFKNVKASADAAKRLLAEVIRLAKLFEEQGMFQNVDLLAPQFVVQRNASDRHRFDVLTPVNVVPNLHEIATQVQAGTAFDALTL